jgi:hypothetical protein
MDTKYFGFPVTEVLVPVESVIITILWIGILFCLSFLVIRISKKSLVSIIHKLFLEWNTNWMYINHFQ